MNNVKFELIVQPSYTTFSLAALPAITTAGSGHAVDDFITFNGDAVGSGIKVKVLTIDGSGGVASYSWQSGGIGWASSEVATQSKTTGSGIGASLTLGSIETTYSPVGYGFFSDPLTAVVAASASNATLFNSAGVEFAFSQFNPGIPDLHALIGVPASNGFIRLPNVSIWVEGDLASWPYGDNVTFYLDGVAYPFEESWIGNGAATWSDAAATGQTGFSRLEWFTSTGPLAERAPTVIEGDKIGMSLTVPDTGPGTAIDHSIITNNIISKG